MTKLDSAIANIGYILDCLCALRDISENGCCNDCAVITHCQYVPDCGEMVRYNCPFYERFDGHESIFD